MFSVLHLLWITVNLHNFPEIKRSPSLQGGVGFHWHVSLERLPYALRLQVGGDNHQQKHGAEETQTKLVWTDSWVETLNKMQPSGVLLLVVLMLRCSTERHSPHDERHYNVELQLPARSGQGLRTCSQHVVGQGGVQDKHKLRASTCHQFQLPYHSRWSEVGCKPVRKGSFKFKKTVLNSTKPSLI